VSAAYGWAERCVGRRQQRWATRFAKEKKRAVAWKENGPRGEKKEWAAAAGLRAEKKEKKIFLFFFGFFFKTNSKMQLQLNSKSDFKLSNSK